MIFSWKPRDFVLASEFLGIELAHRDCVALLVLCEEVIRRQLISFSWCSFIQ